MREEEPEYDDYRLSLLGSDAAALSLVVVGGFVTDDNQTLGNWSMGLGVATYALGGPIIHLVHEQPGRALGSFGLRVGLPGVGLVIIAGLASSCSSSGEDDWCELAAIAVGGTVMLGGVLTAMIVDDGFLGNAQKSRANETRDAHSFQAGLAPLIDPKQKSVGLSLVGAF